MHNADGVREPCSLGIANVCSKYNHFIYKSDEDAKCANSNKLYIKFCKIMRQPEKIEWQP